MAQRWNVVVVHLHWYVLCCGDGLNGVSGGMWMFSCRARAQMQGPSGVRGCRRRSVWVLRRHGGSRRSDPRS
eukprot:5860579-Lingulodinium_polyedra.AAC.1